MPNRLFGEVSERTERIGASQGYSVPVVMFAEALVIAGLVVIPLMAADVLPSPASKMAAYAFTPVVPPPPPPPAPPRDKPDVAPSDPSVPPNETPTGFKPEPEYVPPSDPGGPDTGGTVTGDPKIDLEPPPPPPPAPESKRDPVPVGGNIQAPTKVRHVPPVYPAIAQAARISGIVIIQATIDETGRVTDTRLLRSIPLLDAAAVEAVRQWGFTPTMLNGKPIAVTMTVTVNFALQ